MKLIVGALVLLGVTFINIEKVRSHDSIIIDRGMEEADTNFSFLVDLEIMLVHWCNGALIREDFVLTAAHCYWKDLFLVRAGHTEGGKGGQTRTAQKWFAHPNYSGVLKNNIALIKLEKPFDLTNNVQVAPIWTSKKSTIGSQLAFIGWAKFNYTYERIRADIQIFSKFDCFEKDIILPPGNRTFCAIETNGFCEKEEGSLAIRAGGIVGVMVGRCIYNDIYAYISWIEEHLPLNSLIIA